MKKNFRIWIKIILCFFIAISFTGCWSAKELNTLAIVMGIGIDKEKEGDEIKMTIQVPKVAETKTGGKDSSGGSGSETHINLHNTGSTISYAMKGFNSMLSRRLFLSDNQVVIFGKSIAEEGLQKYIDFLMRNRETRILVKVFVSEGDASEIFEGKSGFEKLPSKKIGELSKIQEQASQTVSVDLRKLVTKLMSKSTSAIVPIIRIAKDENKNAIYISQTAVFKKDKMVGKLNEYETRGILWGINEVKGGTIIVESPEKKEKVSLDITKAKTRIIPEINGSEINMKIQIKCEGDLSEETGKEDLVNPEAFGKLQNAGADEIKKQVFSALEKSKELNADIFEFGEILNKHYPKLWKQLEKDWNGLFQKINVEMDVQVKLQRSGRITKPIISE